MSLVADSSTLEATVRWLAGFTAERAPVTTFYLDVDGRRHPRHVDVERRADRVLRATRTRLDGAGDASVEADLRHIGEWIRAGFDRSRTRGLAFFACSAHDLFEVVPLPVAVHDRVVVNHVPAVGQLESVLHDHEPIGVLLADRQRARMFVFELGELTERSELFERGPAGDPGHQDRGDLNPAIEAATAAHLRHAAAVAWRAWQDRPFAHLAIGAPEAIAGSLESMLHPYLRDRVRGRVGVEVSAGLADIRNAALEVEHGVDRAREAALVDRLRGAVATGGRGVAGLGPTLAGAQRTARRGAARLRGLRGGGLAVRRHGRTRRRRAGLADHREADGARAPTSSRTPSSSPSPRAARSRCAWPTPTSTSSAASEPCFATECAGVVGALTPKVTAGSDHRTRQPPCRRR